MFSNLPMQRRKRIAPRPLNRLSTLRQTYAHLLGPARQRRRVEAWKLTDSPTMCSFNGVPLHQRKMASLTIHKV
jgi:hypothetical protein